MHAKPGDRNTQIIMRKIGNHIVYVKVNPNESDHPFDKMIVIKYS